MQIDLLLMSALLVFAVAETRALDVIVAHDDAGGGAFLSLLLSNSLCGFLLALVSDSLVSNLRLLTAIALRHHSRCSGLATCVQRFLRTRRAWRARVATAWRCETMKRTLRLAQKSWLMTLTTTPSFERR